MMVLLSLVLVACGGGGADPEPTQVPKTPAATPTPIPSLALGEVVFSQSLDASGQPSDPAVDIPRSATTIIASVPVKDVPADTSFSVSWTMDGTVVPGLESSTTLPDGGASGWVSFTLTWEGAALWPVGQLGVTVTASSGETVTGSVPISST